MNQGAIKTLVLATLLASTGFILGLAVLVKPAQAGSVGIFDASSFTSTDGRNIYEHICRGCHMADGGGAVGAGHYPALASNAALNSREYMILTVLMGRRNMPAFGVKHAIGFNGPPFALSDAQVAAVVNYVRSNFGNHYKDTTSAAEVAKLDSAMH